MTTPDNVEGPFDEAVIKAVLSHMNDHHSDDALLISSGLGQVEDGRSAVMSGMDPSGAHFTVIRDDDVVDVVVPWSRELQVRADVRDDIARMYRHSCAILGITPRGGE